MGIFLYRCYYSKMKVVFFLFIFPIRVQIPTIVLLPLWFLIDLVGGIDSLRGIPQNVAFWAHVGGFLAGIGSCRYLDYGTQARIERLEFVAESSPEQQIAYGRDIEAARKLLDKVPENPELHLQLARAMSRWKTSPEGREHYHQAIRYYLQQQPEKALDIFIEFWKKYLVVFEPPLQLRLSMLLRKYGHTDLASHTLRALIDSPQPPDLAMEQAYLALAKIYKDDLKSEDAALFVYKKLLERFPTSRYRDFIERELLSIQRRSGS
jgi:tetratricopeptide (TPR) repeat protein